MSVKYGKFEMPQKISIVEESATPTFARFIAEPFERGFGHTLGNSLRRMLLTSLEAPSVIAIRIEGVPHEYIGIEGVVEDMTNIILNIKGALLSKLPSEESPTDRDTRVLTTVLEITQDDLDQNKGQYIVTLGDIVKNGFYEVINPELPLFTVTQPFKRQIDLTIAMGRGYVPSERHHLPSRSSDQILIDSAFSPIRLVNYTVENTRVGQDTDYDKLILEVTTDGRISPADAVSFAAQIAAKHYDVFNRLKMHSLAFEEGRGGNDTNFDEMMDKLALRIDEIELSVRSTNCLSGANIETIGELVIIPERRMLEFKNFGKKSLNEIKAKLIEMNLSLGMDLSKFGLNSENVKERMRKYHDERRGRRDRDHQRREDEK